MTVSLADEAVWIRRGTFQVSVVVLILKPPISFFFFSLTF